MSPISARTGLTALTGSTDGTVRLWDVAEWPDECGSDVTLRVEAMTGLALDEEGAIRALALGERSGERVGRLTTKGMPAPQRPRWSLGAILNSPRADRLRQGMGRARAMGRGRSGFRRGRQSPA